MHGAVIKIGTYHLPQLASFAAGMIVIRTEQWWTDQEHVGIRSNSCTLSN